MIHEYAGFKFTIVFDSTGKAVSATALPGQHEAAYKERHARNAVRSYLADTGRFDLVRNATREAAHLPTYGSLKSGLPSETSRVSLDDISWSSWSKTDAVPPERLVESSEKRKARVTKYLDEHPDVTVRLASGRWTPPTEPVDSTTTHWRTPANFMAQAADAAKKWRALPKVGEYYGECPSCDAPMHVVERIPPDEVMVECQNAACGNKEKHR